MGLPVLSRSARQRVSCLLLVVFAFRALIPHGFMPSAQDPFALEICPDGFPVHLLPASAHAHAPEQGWHAHGHEHEAGHDLSPATADHSSPAHQIQPSNQHCLFGAASGVGPVSIGLPALVRVDPQAVPPPRTAVLFSARERHSLAQPRAPPVLS